MSPKKDKKTDKKLARCRWPWTSSDNELTEAEINDLQENIQVSDWARVRRRARRRLSGRRRFGCSGRSIPNAGR